MSDLTEKQRAVLTAVYHYINEHDRPPGEYQVSRVVIDRRMWPTKDHGVYLYGHLKKLTDRGFLERHGNRTSYKYTLTTAGRDALI